MLPCHAFLVFFGPFLDKYFPLEFFFLGVEEDNFELLFQLQIIIFCIFCIFCGFFFEFFFVF